VLLEVTTFGLVPGADEGAFLAADSEVQEALSPRPGFLRRTTARGEAGEWLVLVHWDSAAHADAAPPPVPTDLVDPASVRTARYATLD
jgi:hypothetical protein